MLLLLSGGPPTITSWVQKTLNTVDLVATDEPLHIDPSGENDGLNLDNYAVTGPTPPFPDRLLQYVEYVNENILRLWFDGELVRDEIYEIEISNLKAIDGASFISPITVDLTAFGADSPVVPIRFDKVESWDLANPQVERDSQGYSLGTLSADETGDLAVEKNRAALRKRILRRCTTRPGGFAHLEYYGLHSGLKGLIKPTALRKLQQDAEAQVAMEPGVISVRAIVSQIETGGAYLSLKVRDRHGEFDIGTSVGDDE